MCILAEHFFVSQPTSALDPISTLKIEDLMGELKKNYTVVIVTHNMQQATRIADYTAFFLDYLIGGGGIFQPACDAGGADRVK